MRRNNLYYIIVCILLVLTIAYVKAQGSQLKIPLLMPLENLPEELKEFLGENIYLHEEIDKYDSADDWIFRAYKRRDEDISIFVFVGYWKNQNENKLIVSPRYVSGAQSFIKKKTITNRLNDTFVLNEFLTDNKQQKELIYYCFFMDGKVIPDDYKFRFLRMINSLFYRKNNAALLRVSVPITSDFPVEAAELYIEDFLKEFMPIVKEYLPR
jgi:EpsI family protein